MREGVGLGEHGGEGLAATARKKGSAKQVAVKSRAWPEALMAATMRSVTGAGSRSAARSALGSAKAAGRPARRRRSASSRARPGG